MVQTCMYMFIHLHTSIASYKHVHTKYMNCTDIDEQCTYIVQLCTYIDISFQLQLFDSPGWLACWLGLAAAWCHTYSSSTLV